MLTCIFLGEPSTKPFFHSSHSALVTPSLFFEERPRIVRFVLAMEVEGQQPKQLCGDVRQQWSCVTRGASHERRDKLEGRVEGEHRSVEFEKYRWRRMTGASENVCEGERGRDITDRDEDRRADT